jgi:hypothetical protein
MVSTTFQSPAEVVDGLADIDDNPSLVRRFADLGSKLKEIDDRPPGYEYMLEIETVQDVIETWSLWRDGRVPRHPTRARQSSSTPTTTPINQLASQIEPTAHASAADKPNQP